VRRDFSAALSGGAAEAQTVGHKKAQKDAKRAAVFCAFLRLFAAINPVVSTLIFTPVPDRASCPC
jgi:hypothetical protein